MSAEREAALWREIVELVPGQYVYHHGVWLVGIGVAPKVVEFLRDRNVLILGFEGFEVDGTSRRARLDAITDCSRGLTGAFQNDMESAAQIALRVLKELASRPLFFDFAFQFEDDEPFPDTRSRIVRRDQWADAQVACRIDTHSISPQCRD